MLLDAQQAEGQRWPWPAAVGGPGKPKHSRSAENVQSWAAP